MEYLKKLRDKKARQRRTRSSILGTADRPRMSVNISNRNISVQLIDDVSGKTLLSSSSLVIKSSSASESAEKVGADIASKALKAKIKKVVFDRGSRKYHGNVSKLADSARKNGLEF